MCEVIESAAEGTSDRRSMDATELFKHKQALREAIRDTVKRRDVQRLKAISAAVNELEQELLEAFWELDELSKSMKRSAASRAGRAMLSIWEEFLRGYSLFMMGTG